MKDRADKDRAGAKLPQAQRKAIARRYLAGEKGTSLAREYGVDPKYVYKLHTKLNGDTVRTPTKRGLDDKEKAEIVRRRAAGEKVTTIASDFNMTPARISQIAAHR